MKTPQWLDKITDAVPFLRKWGTWQFCKENDEGIDKQEFEMLWAQAKASFVPGGNDLLGRRRNIIDQFMKELIEYQSEQGEVWICRENNCRIEVFRDKVKFSIGPAGCPCDDYDDPRGNLLQEK